MHELLLSVTNDVKQLMRAQAVNANNLANASTDGFKAEIAFMVTSQRMGSLSSVPDLSSGSIKSTGRDLDVAVNGEGWIAVVGADGTEAYSRRGDLHIDAFGQLSNGAGQLVLGNGGPIALPPFGAVEVGADGTVSVLPLGQNPNSMAIIDRIKLVTLEESDIVRGEDGLMRLASGNIAASDASVQLLAGNLEASNVNTVSEMVKMIELARRFEAQVQLMQSAEENSQALSRIMRMS